MADFLSHFTAIDTPNIQYVTLKSKAIDWWDVRAKQFDCKSVVANMFNEVRISPTANLLSWKLYRPLRVGNDSKRLRR